MESKFNFKSAICTSRVQSERLLALGLKKETADMYWVNHSNLWMPVMLLHEDRPLDNNDTPAWSLGRLIEMLPSPIPISEYFPTFHHYAYLNLSQVSVDYSWEYYDGEERALVGFCGNGFFAAVVDAIEWLIKEVRFNKEYLV